MIPSSREITFYAPTGTMWHQDYNPKANTYRDRYNVWIVLTEKGVKYFKHVVITGREHDDGSGVVRLIQIMQECWELGHEEAGMSVVDDGGFLPITGE